jgi:hypothetical protein
MIKIKTDGRKEKMNESSRINRVLQFLENQMKDFYLSIKT